MAIGGEYLLAVDHVLITIADGLGADVLNIATAGRLAHAQCHDHIADGHLWKPVGFLRLRTEVHNVGCDDVRVKVEGRTRCAYARHLFNENRTVKKVGTLTAEGLWRVDAQQA